MTGRLICVSKLVRSGVYHGTPIETIGRHINIIIATCFFAVLLLCPNDFLYSNFLAFEILFPV